MLALVVLASVLIAVGSGRKQAEAAMMAEVTEQQAATPAPTAAPTPAPTAAPTPEPTEFWLQKRDSGEVVTQVQSRLMELGCAIEHAEVFPRRTNVNFVHVLDEHNVEMRTWERGCGPTLACGTGACSAVVACVLNGKTARSVDVNIELGTLHIEWAADDNLYMTGPATLNCFTGEVEV